MDYGRLLKGKVAVITSGAHGMGNAIAKLFAQHGAVCAINGMRDSGEESAVELRKVSPKSFFVRCDMSKKDETENFIAEVLSRVGTVDIVVNNVGINHNGLIEKITDEDFEYTQQVNLHGVLRMARGFLPKMNSGGSLIHISTIHSVAGLVSFTSYASSKSAINAFSGALAAEYGQFGIRSNVVCPGGVYTRDAEKRLREVMDDDDTLVEWGIGGEGGHPDYGCGSVKDIANACLFLASDMARYVTGAVVMSDGGASYQAHHFRQRRIPPDSRRLWLEFMRDRL